MATNLLQYRCLENSMDRGAWRAIIVHGVAKLDMTETHTRRLYFHESCILENGVFVYPVAHVSIMLVFSKVCLSELTCFLSHSLSRLKPLLSLKDFYNNLTSLSLSISLLFQFSPIIQSCLTFYDPMDCSTPGFPVHHYLLSLLKFMSVVSVMPSNHLILCHPLLLLPSIFPSIRVFSSKSVLRIRWLKYWSFSININSSNKHPGLISFRMD